MNKNQWMKGATVLSLFILLMTASIVTSATNTIKEDISTEYKTFHITSSYGDTIYVDDDNTAGPWDGTIEHPYQFIQDGVDNAQNDDTVFVFNGTYFENVMINKKINASPIKRSQLDKNRFPH